MKQSRHQTSAPPPDCGDFDIRIAADGTWHYRGSPIGRMALVRLFASVLRRDESGQYWLETPAESGRIQVEDAPFVAVELTVEGEGRGQSLRFRTNTDDMVTAGLDHPIAMRPAPGGVDLRPYLHVRGGIEAVIARPVYYALADLVEEQTVEGQPRYGVWSGGAFFPLAPPVGDTGLPS